MLWLFVRGVRAVSKILNGIGQVFLAILMFLGTADVLGRYFFNRPILGTFEISEILLAGVVFFGWAYVLYQDKHIAMEVIYSHLSPYAKKITDVITRFFSLFVFSLMAWRVTATAFHYKEVNRLLPGLLWPAYPFVLFVSLGAVLLCLELIIQIFYLLFSFRDMSRR
jgi:TRAP-type C4-dicarboxylate transport system permease small subunit